MTDSIVPATLLESGLAIELVPISALVPHPQNYRRHPQEQLDHLALSLQTNGFYRPVVTAHDLTILAGHGIVQAARLVGIDPVPVHRTRYRLDDPEALKILVGDNESPRLARNDDAALAELLVQIRDESEAGLEGTGWDEEALAVLSEAIRSGSPGSGTPADEQAASDREYARTIQSPIYQVTGDMPAVADLVDTRKRDTLVVEIVGSRLEPEVEAFLIEAASRHLKFDYALVAEFYAHAEPQVQALMEQSALVIIDAEQAIELGYAKLVGDLLEIAGEAEGDPLVEDDDDDIPQ